MTGRFRVVTLLAARDIRRHRAEMFLLLVAFTAATAALALGLILNGASDAPYQQTRQASAGPDVVAQFNPGPGAPTANGLAALAQEQSAPGVVGHSGPFPVTWTTLKANGHVAGAQVQGRDAAPTSVDQPYVTQGSWIGAAGTAVVERTFADALGVTVGDKITLGAGQQFTISGIAVDAAIPPYPLACDNGCENSTTRQAGDRTGTIWVAEADARALATTADPLYYFMNIKLADPANADSFVLVDHSADPRYRNVYFNTWESISQLDDRMVTGVQQLMVFFAWLLGLLALCSVAVLVGGRMAAQSGRVGLLKAVGASPRLVAVVLLAEYLVVAVLAAGAGLLVGYLMAPLVTSPGAGLLGAAPAPRINALTAVAVFAVAVLVVAVATLIPAVRAARMSTVRALAAPVHAPKRHGGLIRFSARLPVPLLLGLRIMARRYRRALLSVLSIAVTVSGVATVLAARQRVTLEQIGASDTLDNPVVDRIGSILTVVTVMIGALAAINAVFVTWANINDVRRSSALTRALGATPGQVTAALVVAQSIPTLIGALLGIPGGVALFAAAQHGDGSVVVPPVAELVGLVVGAVLVIAVLTGPSAQRSNNRPIAVALQAE